MLDSVPFQFSSVQFSSVAQSCLTLCDPMNRSTPGLPVHHQLPEFTQTHIHWVNDIPGSYAILLFIALDLASITSHIHSWVFFLLWLHPIILSGVISPLISSSILGTYWRGEFVFQYPIILPFHTVRGVLKARILKWFAIPCAFYIYF